MPKRNFINLTPHAIIFKQKIGDTELEQKFAPSGLVADCRVGGHIVSEGGVNEIPIYKVEYQEVGIYNLMGEYVLPLYEEKENQYLIVSPLVLTHPSMSYRTDLVTTRNNPKRCFEMPFGSISVIECVCFETFGIKETK